MKTVKLTKEQQMDLDDRVAQYKGLRIAIRILSRDLYISEKQMWNYVKKVSNNKEILELNHDSIETKIILK